jgi:DNA-binding NtrC family response regulator
MTSDEIDHDTVMRCFKMGANDIITKPFIEETVIEKIKKVLALKKPTVLVVDDEKDILDILKNIMEIEKFKVFTALSAEEGLEILEENEIDAVVSDINFPGMSGVELMGIVKEKYEKIPVILITGYSHRYTPKFAKEAGADGFFNKPFKNTDLIRKLKQVMPNHFMRTY